MKKNWFEDKNLNVKIWFNTEFDAVEFNNVSGYMDNNYFGVMKKDGTSLHLFPHRAISGIEIEYLPEESSPENYNYTYKFLVRDTILDKIVSHPVTPEGLEPLNVLSPEGADFAIDKNGKLLVIDRFGNYTYALPRYKLEGEYNFSVRDTILNKIVEKPSAENEFKHLLRAGGNLEFAVDQIGCLLIINQYGDYVYTNFRYRIDYNE